MLILLRRYWRAIPIAAVFVVAVILEWSSANRPQPPTYAAAPQIPALAASQPRAPGAEELRSAPTDNATINTGTTQPDQRGTNQMPVIAKVVAQPLYERKSAEDAQEPKQRAMSENDLADYTLYLVIATGALASIGLGQAGLFLWQLRIMKEGLADTTAATLAAAQQTEITRRQYIASNRPRLRARKISIDHPVVGNPITVRYEVVNVGGTRARIIDNEITVRISDMPGSFVLYHDGGREVVATRQFHFADEVQQGEALLASGQILRFEPTWGFDAGAWWTNRLYVIGVIRYMDDNGVTRRTAFYRRATDDLNRFVIAPIGADALADHEYED